MILLSHPRSLYRRKKTDRAKHGFSVEIYSRFFDEFVTQQTGDKVGGHIMVKEMKLKSGI